MSKRIGVLLSWHFTKQIGTIIDRSTEPPERFFLPGGRVVSGPEPKIGSIVMFDVEQRPSISGRLPVAINAEVLSPEVTS